MDGRLHSGDRSSFTVLFRHSFYPCFECHETDHCVAEFQRFLCKLIVPLVKCPGIMSFNANNQSFSVMDVIFAYCVLQFILDTSLFNKIFTNRLSQQSYFTLRSLFSSSFSWESLYLYYTGSSI